MVVDKVKTYRSHGTRIEPDFTEDDEGIYLFNSEGWHDIDEVESLIKTLSSVLAEIKEKQKKRLTNGITKIL